MKIWERKRRIWFWLILACICFFSTAWGLSWYSNYICGSIKIDNMEEIESAIAEVYDNLGRLVEKGVVYEAFSPKKPGYDVYAYYNNDISLDWANIYIPQSVITAEAPEIIAYGEYNRVDLPTAWLSLDRFGRCTSYYYIETPDISIEVRDYDASGKSDDMLAFLNYLVSLAQ